MTQAQILSHLYRFAMQVPGKLPKRLFALPLSILTIAIATTTWAQDTGGAFASLSDIDDEATIALTGPIGGLNELPVTHPVVSHPVVSHPVADHPIVNPSWACNCAFDDHLKHGRVDSHAPAFLMGDHVHKEGGWMVEYKYSTMYMNGNRSGTNKLTTQQALDFIGTAPPGVPGVSAYGATPTSMTMEMHMLHIMHGVTDDITAYIMPMWMVNTMDHRRRNGSTFRVSNSGFSDMRFGALWRVHNGSQDELILNLGLSSPTGDIDNQTSIPTGMPSEFPYPMRLGSGTWDATPALVYKFYWERSSLGLQGSARLPMGLNRSDYRVGNEYQASAWFTRLLNCEKTLAATARIEGLWRSNYVGADPNLNQNLISTADPDMRGGEFLNLGYGMMYMLPNGGRLNVETVHPVVQNLRGVQLERHWSLAASYSKAF